MVYNLKNLKDNLRILGKEFVKNNKNKGVLIINNKKYNLTEFNPLINYNKEELKINLVLKEINFNESCMFSGCISLISVYIYENNKNFEITNDKEFIYQEESVDKYFDIFQQIEFLNSIHIPKILSYQKKMKIFLIV